MRSFGLILLFLLTAVAYSQNSDHQFSTTDKKALKLITEAQQAYQADNYELTIEKLNEAILRDPEFVDAYDFLGYVYFEKHDMKNAIPNFRKVALLNPSKFPRDLLLLAELLVYQGLYEEAKGYYTHFLTFRDSNSEDLFSAKQGLVNCDFAIEAMLNPVNFEPINMGEAINSDLNEYFPCLTADESTLLYTRELNDPRTPSGRNEDFFMSQKIQGEWTRGQNVGKPINSFNNEGAPTLSANGALLIFTACEVFGNYGPERNGLGSCDLFFTMKKGKYWTNPRNLAQPVNSKIWETQPSFSSDNRTLYFIRGNRTAQGMKNQDIWKTVLTDTGWTNPVPLSKVINTPGKEASVFIHPDGKTLYFASDGHPGMGGLDLFISRMDANGEWTQAVNLGYPINTWKDESSLLVGASGEVAYFASDREGGFGGLDMYSFKLPKEVRPDLVTYMKGLVFNKDSRLPLEAKFELIDLESGELVVESYSDESNGEFLVALPINRNYALNVSKDGYLFYSDNFALKESETAAQPYRKDVPLTPIKVGSTVVLNNIFFETNKYDLKVESKIELGKIVSFLKSNPDVRIELSGHTDNTGGKDFNISLSNNRAKSVYNYLIGAGIPAERLEYKGYGDGQPIDTNETEQGKANNRRTEFKVVSIG